MPLDKNIVEQQLKELDVTYNSLNRNRELILLPSVLDKDETIYAICAGFSIYPCLVVVTQKRIIILSKKLWGASLQTDIIINKISHITRKKGGLFAGKIKIDTAHGTIELTNLSAECVQQISEAVRIQLEKQNKILLDTLNTKTQQLTLVEQLEKLIKLRQENLINQEDFEKIKNKLSS